MNICKDIHINIKVPIHLDSNIELLYDSLNKEGYNLFNPKDIFYNDICSKFTTEDKTDISLIDRREYIYKNISLCQKNCELIFYNSTSKKAECDCEIQTNETITNETKIELEYNQLLKSFSTTISSSNYKILTCYKLVFSLKGHKNNIGSYIMIIIFSIIIILIIIYFRKDYKKISEYINQILNFKLDNNKKSGFIKTINENINIIKKNKKLKKKLKYNNKELSKISERKSLSKTSKIVLDSNLENKIPNSKNNNMIIEDINKEKRKSVIIKQNLQNYSIKNNNIIENMNKEKRKSAILTNIENIKDYNIKNKSLLRDDELNSLIYIEALKLDKRNYIEYYISLIKKKNIIIFTFFLFNDYNLITIKLILFLLSLSLYFVINGLFFSDKTMHKIFIDKGKYNLIFEIPQIIYSSIITFIINTILKQLSLSETMLINFKNEEKQENDNELKKKAENKEKCIKQKFCAYFILSLLLMSFYWYYISCFCAVYENTQIIFIKNIFISFGLSMIYPLGLSLLPGIFRIMALRARKKDKTMLYKISLILSMF